MPAFFVLYLVKSKATRKIKAVSYCYSYNIFNIVNIFLKVKFFQTFVF